ncbi:oxidation resistance protein 1 [Marasmius crinis-equi]|uniref:Oxidation resistance protein 1 n=1 Tax=Marasmius crinis-equi TaxID=585013 RepID=A0ABR3F708_9AGAR
MSSTISSIPPLIPVPASSGSSTNNNHPLDEEMIDKFATLFSPPTPRASPTPRGDNDSIWKTPEPTKRHQPSQYFEQPLSPDSEFGSFVSVPASEDPLADADFSFGESSSSPTTSNRRMRAPSLSFFDQFAKEAKDASERNKKGVLDELLSAEKDPTFSGWTPNGSHSQSSAAVSAEPQPIQRSTSNDSDHDPEQWGPPELSESLIDLDHNFFTPQGRHHRRSRTVESHTHPSRHATLSSSPSFPHSPSRSPTLSTLAPPVASAAAVGGEGSRPALTTRSSSYQTLSNISAKWMSGLLSSSSTSTSSSSASTTSTPSHPTRVSIDSIFSHTPYLNAGTSTTTASTTHQSPFAPHVFVPGSISGAPGFTGVRYDWDKGYSKELSEEFEAERSGSTSLRPSPGLPSKSPSPSPQPQPTMGGLIAKKNGHVELKGRRESTEEVLDVGLADKIRAHLPALSRLPKSWSLLYSLDQHGISLNTLYAKTEAASGVRVGASGFATRTGALVIVKDSDGTLFGVYVGDGLHKGKGYYGSGESFLWRYEQEEKGLEVFKWTGKNDYVALCEGEYLSFGGGDGTYGLYIDETLLEGSSARCPTFENPPLCSASGAKKGRTVSFECVGLEVWGVGP